MHTDHPPLNDSNLTSPATGTGNGWVRAGWRAATGRRLGNLPTRVNPLQWLAGLVCFNGLAVLLHRGLLVGPADFSPSGWVFSLAFWPIALLLVWLTLQSNPQTAQHAEPTAAWVLLYTIATLPLMLLVGVWAGLWMHELLPPPLSNETAGWVVLVLSLIWLGWIVWRITERLQSHKGLVVALCITMVVWQAVASLWLHSSPWEKDYSAEAARPVLTLSQEVFEAQETLLAQTLEQVPGEGADPIQVYGLVYSPYAEDVFLRESQMVGDVIRERLNAGDRVVSLVNHPLTTETSPWATPRNLRRAIQAIAQNMQREQDVLLIYFTSHGGDDHRLASSHHPLAVDDLTAEEVRQWLDEAGIRYRAIAVSACYSGGWVAPLSNEHTLVMTAADPENTSYGCGARSELTFFGRAVFDEAMRKSLSLEEAFASAVPVIRQREIDAGKDDGFSNPQIQVGTAFRDHWNRWMASRPR